MTDAWAAIVRASIPGLLEAPKAHPKMDLKHRKNRAMQMVCLPLAREIRNQTFRPALRGGWVALYPAAGDSINNLPRGRPLVVRPFFQAQLRAESPHHWHALLTYDEVVEQP